jgi:hypothetical protein
MASPTASPLAGWTAREPCAGVRLAVSSRSSRRRLVPMPGLGVGGPARHRRSRRFKAYSARMGRRPGVAVSHTQEFRCGSDANATPSNQVLARPNACRLAATLYTHALCAISKAAKVLSSPEACAPSIISDSNALAIRTRGAARDLKHQNSESLSITDFQNGVRARGGATCKL